MSDTITPAPKKRNLLKITGFVLGLLLVILIAAYFIGTSSGFIRKVVLPKVSESIGAEVTASHVALSPFKQIVIKDLKVQPSGHEALFTSPEVVVKYRLFDIMKGNFNIDLVSLASPVISLVTRPDAKSNLDPVMEALGPSDDEPMNMDLRKLVITDGTIRQEQQPSAAGSSLMEITKLNVNIDGLKTGGVGKLDMRALLSMRTEAPAPGTNGTFSAAIKGSLDLGLTPMLMANVVKGGVRMDISQATGGFALASGKAVTFDADVTSAEVKQLALRFVQGQETLAELAANGPFSIEKVEGQLQVRLANVDRNTLNLFAAGSGMDFARTSISSTNQIQAANGGKTFTIAGAFFVNDLQVIQTNQSTPILNFQAAYDASVDQAASNAVVRNLTLNGVQQGKQFLKGALTAPMIINWGSASQGVGDSTFLLTVDQFDLAAWKAFMGDSLVSGILNSKVEVTSTGSGKNAALSHNTRIENLSINAGESRISDIQVVLSGNGKADNMETFETKFDLELSQAGSRALQVAGTASFNSPSESARADIDGTASIPPLVRMAAVQDASFASGAAEFHVAFQQKKENQQVQGTFNLQNLTGSLGSNVFQNFAAASQFEVAMDRQKADIRKSTIELSQDGKAAGVIDLNGSYGLNNGAAKIKLALKDLNQNLLRSFLQPALGDQKLISIAINGQSDIDYEPEKPSTIAADFKLSNFVVTDPKAAAPPKPLDASFVLDTAINNNVAEIRKGLVALTPTDRAKNHVQISGKTDFSNAEGTSGNINVFSDGLDLTAFYKAFRGGTTPSQAEAETQPAPEQEPEPVILPLTNFVVEVAIKRFFLDEVDIADLVMNTRIDGGRVGVNPLRLTLNGAPVSSSVALDMSIPGYRYDILFGMTNVPFAPLVNTFTPERKGQLGGQVSASTQVKGAGTTGANLQKHLEGYFNMDSTNLNFDISQMRSPLLKTVVNVVAMVPGIIKNPGAGALSSLAGALFGGQSGGGASAAGGAWAEELLKSPVDVISASADMGGGQVKLKRGLVQSRAFVARAQGTVTLAEILTNSTMNIPLNVSIARHLAESVSLVPPNTPTNAVYVTLPDYVALKGTLGEPSADVNTRALVGTALQQFGGQIPGVDKKTGNMLQGLGGVLSGGGGGGAGTNAPVDTNAPAATNRPVENLIKGIFGPRKK